MKTNGKQTDIEIRALYNGTDMKKIEQLNDLVYGPGDAVPSHLLTAIARNGGLVLGAFEADRLVAFLYSFLGMYTIEGNTYAKHTSHQLVVLPEYWNANLGFQLKRAQAQFVRNQGLDFISWTYDPLETRNATLNISKLGAICNTYIENYYGNMGDELNAGIPTDRFQVAWWITSNRVEKRLSQKSRGQLNLEQYLAGNALLINQTKISEPGFIAPHQDQMNILEQPDEKPAIVLFEVPSNYQEMKKDELALAKEWRQYSRILFNLFFGQGYYVTDFLFERGSPSRCYYVLSDGEAVLE